MVMIHVSEITEHIEDNISFPPGSTPRSSLTHWRSESLMEFDDLYSRDEMVITHLNTCLANQYLETGKFMIVVHKNENITRHGKFPPVSFPFSIYLGKRKQPK